MEEIAIAVFFISMRKMICDSFCTAMRVYTGHLSQIPGHLLQTPGNIVYIQYMWPSSAPQRGCANMGWSDGIGVLWLT